MARKSSKSIVVKGLDYRKSMTVAHEGGRLVTVVGATDSLNSWTRNKRNRHGEGLTVRTDNVQTFRFTGVTGVVDNRS